MFKRPRYTPSATNAARRPIARSAAAGFTLVEVLIAVGIIGILATIIAISINTVMASSKAKATRAALENCVSLQAEYENAAKLPGSIRTKFDATGTIIPAMPSHVVATIFAMEKLPQVPKVKEMIDRLPGGSMAYLDTTVVPTWLAATTYAKGDVVQYGPPAGALFRSRVDGNSGNTPTPGTTSDEWAVIPLPISALTDGWGNPIYCAGTALELSQMYSASEPYAIGEVATDGTKSYKCVKAAKGVPLSDPNHWSEVSATRFFVRSAPNGRVFWVSGGPDGDVLSDDDNVYSFEN